MAKVALRFGCAKQSKNLEWYLINMLSEKEDGFRILEEFCLPILAKFV